MTTRFLTTPIYYVNDVPHVGHAYTTIAADALTRARRLRGWDAFLLTGTDEHGQNIERIAREKGITPQEHCDRVAAEFRRLWERLGIRPDRFIRTTDPLHVRGVLALWARLRQARTPDGREAVYRGKYAGWYCPRCEEFKEEEDLLPDRVCPTHERPCEWTEEENFFFRLSAYEGWLREEIVSGRFRIEPEVRRHEVLAVIRQGLRDFSVSRARVKWGIPVPEQPDHVLYVWVDALSNYVTALGFADDGPDYRRYWASAEAERFHLLGKDIIRFHSIYWPTILHAAGLPTPNREFAQGFITRGGRRLSKSTGNVIDPVELCDRLGPDVMRYFLLREAPYGQDWDFTDEAYVARYNADLANDFGNLVSRALTMAARYGRGRVPPRPSADGAGPGLEGRLQEDAPVEGGGLRGGVLARYEALDFAGALVALWSWISELNQRIVAVQPWELAKDPGRRGELDAFLYRLLEAVRLLGVLAGPVVPRTAARLRTMLGLPEAEPVPADLDWGRLEPGARLGVVEPLFPRVDRSTERPARLQEVKVSEAPIAPGVPPAPAGDRIDIAEFARIELRVAQVKAAERLAGSRKLVKLQVDLGSEERQVVAGIAESYAPQDLVGRKVALVANLKPARLMGVESDGMVLAASLDGRAVLLTPDADVPAGTKIK
jgi:methionyl-tRNA synthetase